MMKLFFLILFFFFPFLLNCQEREVPSELGFLPVYYEGRICPLDACASSWMQTVYHRDRLLPEHRQFFRFPIATPLDFLWSLHSQDIGRFPLFWIGEKEIKEVLQLDVSVDRFCYEDLRHVIENVLAFNLKVIEQMILSSFFKLSQGVSIYPGQTLHLRVIDAEIECLFSEHEILVTAAPALIPWNFLRSHCRSSPYVIELKDPGTIPHWIKSLQTLLKHFLQFKDLQFSKTLLNSVFSSPFPETAEQTEEVSSSYESVLRSAHEGPIEKILPSLEHFFALYRIFQQQFSSEYPSYLQLGVEKFFIKYPILRSSAVLYFLSLLCFIFHSKRSLRKAFGKPLMLSAWLALVLGFILHSGALFFKTVVFSNPPVLSLFDSCLFLSWLSIVVGFLFFWIFATRVPMIAALVFVQAIFTFLYALNIRDPFQVDSMFASNFWLTLPSMMIIMSYCVLFLGGILGHFSLTRVFRREPEVVPDKLARCIVLCLYLGIFLLVIGTILGTLWTESTWRYSWKTEEGWISISICFYLVVFHLNHFKWVDSFFIALGAALGMILLSLISYGTKLIHSELFHFRSEDRAGLIYLFYLILEVCFFFVVLSKKLQRKYSLSRDPEQKKLRSK